MNPPPAKRPDSDRRRQPAPPQKQPDNHNVDESVEETFPASDPPALSLERRRQAENDRQRDEKRAREHADSRPTPPATERNP